MDNDTVKRHIFNRGFMPNYYMWYFHGEEYYSNTYIARSSGTSHGVEQSNYNVSYDYGQDILGNDGGY